MFTKEESRKEIKELAESFGEKLDYIRNSGQYKEAQIEDEFIKPIFKETKYIWQAYQYAHSTQSLSQTRKIDFALLTDFEEFRFFECTFPVKIKRLSIISSVSTGCTQIT